MSQSDSRRPRQSNARRRPPISKYYRSGAKAADVDSPFASVNKPDPKRHSKYLVRFIDILVVAAIIFLLVRSSLVNSDAKVIVNDTFYHSLTNYQDSAKKYLGALTNHTKLTFNQSKVISQFQHDYPEVGAASIELPVFSQRPIIRLQVAPPAFILDSGDNKYIVDSQGRAVGGEGQLAKVSNLPLVTDQSGFGASLGKQVLSSGDVLFITDLTNQLKASKIPIKSLVLTKSPSELDLYTADQPYLTKFYLAGDPSVQIGQFLAARHEFSQKAITPSQYLDVRVSGRIFYQ